MHKHVHTTQALFVKHLEHLEQSIVQLQSIEPTTVIIHNEKFKVSPKQKY